MASSGWGIVDFKDHRFHYIAHGCIVTKADAPRAERLYVIYQAFQETLHTYKPQEAAIETLFFSRNAKSAIPVAEARGVLSMALAEQGLPVREFSPNSIKLAVLGAGQAEKRQIQEMVRLILGLQAIPKPDHAADALGAAICCAHTLIPEAYV